VLVAGSAWAAATGRLPRRIAELFVEERTETPHEPAPEPPKRAATAAGNAFPVTSASAASGSALPETVPSAVAPPPPAADPEDRAFRRAHEAHFAAHDWTSALAGWDAYLAAYPHGRFVPEARYNRAIALVRLGRRDEARAALQPFADGTFGGYRQSEARQLLDALE
jgi:TolA-binding protein